MLSEREWPKLKILEIVGVEEVVVQGEWINVEQNPSLGVRALESVVVKEADVFISTVERKVYEGLYDTDYGAPS